MNYKKGFTLIELLVVIAIIGLLSSIVLASLRSASNKGGNAAIKSNMASLRAQGALYYEIGNTFMGVCGDANFVKAIAAITTANGGTAPTCNISASAWSMTSPLKQAEGSNLHWCVDSAGASGGETVAASGTACP